MDPAMDRISSSVRQRIAELGRRSRPLGEAYARELAASVADLVSKELTRGGQADRILEIYEVRLAGEIDKQRAFAAKSYQRWSAYDRVSDALPRFSSADRFDVR